MSHGWTTRKTPTGYTWSVYRTEWSEEAGRGISTTLKTGTASTRARATGAAQRWVLFFRRGGTLPAAA